MKLRVNRAERIVGWRHEHAALDVDHRDRNASDFADPSAFARNAWRVVRGPQQSRLFFDVIEDFFFVEDVVAGSHHINSGGEQVFSDSRRDRETGGGVFDVRDYEINFAFRAQIEAALRSQSDGEFYRRMYGDKPDRWRDDLEGQARLRFIVNCLTRLRVCDTEGRIDLDFKGSLDQLPEGLLPWFRVPGRRTAGERIVCGHWSALGYLDENNVVSIDTGCVWGGPLTALRLDRRSAPIQVPASTARGLPAED